nr:immunoglobulin light chain junction region [Macaca mulatta]MOW73856.1 immunoglobulin light chain junction region [Macaca mulatta]
CQHNSGIPFTF